MWVVSFLFTIAYKSKLLPKWQELELGLTDCLRFHGRSYAAPWNDGEASLDSFGFVLVKIYFSANTQMADPLSPGLMPCPFFHPR
jgi:hypothetical protein